MVSIDFAASNGSPPLTRIPYSAPLPVPTMMAVGVASPKAQGQAMTITDVIAMSEYVKELPKIKYQIMKVPAAIPRTTGTNQAATRSAKA